MKKIIIIFAIIFIGSAVKSQTLSIKGKVFDMGTKLPLTGAVVTLTNNNHETSTNAIGEYIFSHLSEGTYKIKIQFIGYKTNIFTVDLNKDKDESPVSYLSDNTLTISEIQVTSSRDYGKITISPLDMKLRPTNTAQDLLRLVPGLFIAQHAGGGKAEQLFLRGFDLDHGTDINVSIDGIPVNMVSHAHGQGYADMHFTIPEVIEGFDVYKGPYLAKFGDLATSGAVSFTTKNSIEKSFAKLEGGMYDSFRGLLMLDVLGKSKHILTKKKESIYLASEYSFSNGFFVNKQKFSRLNVFGKYYGFLSNHTILSLTGSTFASHWNASGEIPSRGVQEGIITRFGSIDPSEGGNTNRTNFNMVLESSFKKGGSLTNQIYFVNYGFNLFSDFTFFKNDPVNGDEINQHEKRNMYGYKGTYSMTNDLSKSSHLLSHFGIGARADDIYSIYLAHTVKRQFLNYINNGKIFEQNYYGYVDEAVELSKFVINPQLRFDFFNFKLTDALTGSTGSKTDSRFSPKLNLYYNVSPRTQIYAKSGIGFHSNDARVVIVEKNENTLPRALGYEIGTSFSAGNHFSNISLWGLNLQSEFVYTGDEGGVESKGRTRRLGIDFSGRYQFNSWVWADLDINVNNGKLLDAPNTANNIPLAPRLTGVGGISIKLKKGIGGRLGFRAMDSRPANEDNSIIAKGYFLMDLVLNYTSSKYQIGASVENLLDNKSWNEAQFDTESRLSFEKEPVSELHFTPGTPFFIKGNFSIFF